ncbi:hypothetical protein [Lentilactobacillus sp. Marseille-Q4993]|uniref:hypothetical protein n=1 Tax=Lentilactobacillus sp. Marseille-Q4993 TaxID=3039492 RepID=UPI0024BCA1A8|nr:hypothetical protein [Lentilactobacillus sp. Marseille-Q4993]
MKHFKIKLGLTIATASFLTFVPVSNTVHASAWHHGCPKFLKGSWRSSKFKGGIGNKKIRAHLFFSNGGLSMVLDGGNGLGVTNGIGYKHLSGHNYRFRTHYKYGNDYGYYTIKNTSHKRIYQRFNGGWLRYHKISNKLAQY